MSKVKKIKKTLSQAELQKRLKDEFGKSLTRQRLHQLRNGYTVRGTDYDAKLVDGKHFIWEKGNVKYFENAIEIILDQSIKLNAA